jgi:hypothetical protein
VEAVSKQIQKFGYGTISRFLAQKEKNVYDFECFFDLNGIFLKILWLIGVLRQPPCVRPKMGPLFFEKRKTGEHKIKA